MTSRPGNYFICSFRLRYSFDTQKRQIENQPVAAKITRQRNLNRVFCLLFSSFRFCYRAWAFCLSCVLSIVMALCVDVCESLLFDEA